MSIALANDAARSVANRGWPTCCKARCVKSASTASSSTNSTRIEFSRTLSAPVESAGCPISPETSGHAGHAPHLAPISLLQGEIFENRVPQRLELHRLGKKLVDAEVPHPAFDLRVALTGQDDHRDVAR